jgi:hypothetical protein
MASPAFHLPWFSPPLNGEAASGGDDPVLQWARSRRHGTRRDSGYTLNDLADIVCRSLEKDDLDGAIGSNAGGAKGISYGSVSQAPSRNGASSSGSSGKGFG